MVRACKTPPMGGMGGASRDQLPGWSRSNLTLSTFRAQHLIGSYAVRPEIAAMVAALAFGGGGNA